MGLTFANGFYGMKGCCAHCLGVGEGYLPTLLLSCIHFRRWDLVLDPLQPLVSVEVVRGGSCIWGSGEWPFLHLCWAVASAFAVCPPPFAHWRGTGVGQEGGKEWSKAEPSTRTAQQDDNAKGGWFKDYFLLVFVFCYDGSEDVLQPALDVLHDFNPKAGWGVHTHRLAAVAALITWWRAWDVDVRGVMLYHRY